MSQWRYYSNTAVLDTLQVTGGGNLSLSGTSIYAGSGAPSGYPAQFPWILRLEPGTSNEELVLVTAGSGTAGSPWIITRAEDGTTAKTHVAGTSSLVHGLSAGDLTEAAQHFAMGSGSEVHGLPAAAWAAGNFSTFFETTTTAGQASIAWSSIPQTCAHLIIVGQGRLVETSVQSDDMSIQFNGDSGAHYAYATDLMSNPGGTMTGPAPGNGYASGQGPLFRFLASQGGSAQDGGSGFAIVPNYTGSTYVKNWLSISGGGNGTTSFVDLRSRVGIWAPASQAAITAISLIAPTGGFNANCFFGLYGIGG